MMKTLSTLAVAALLSFGVACADDVKKAESPKTASTTAKPATAAVASAKTTPGEKTSGAVPASKTIAKK